MSITQVAYGRAVSITLSLVVLVSTGCSISRPLPSTPTHCSIESASTYHTYDLRVPQSKYVYVLVDKSYGYQYTNNDLGLVQSIVVGNIGPGDRLVVAWMSLERTTGSIFFDEQIEQIKPPRFSPTLTPPAMTSTLTPGGPTTIKGMQIQTSEAIERNNDASEEQHNCLIGQWNIESDQLYLEWQTRQQGAVDEFVDKGHHQIPLLASEEVESGKLVYESLSVASRMLRSSIGKNSYAKYLLIVFSDLDDWRDRKPDGTTIDFRGIGVMVISQPCKYEVDCGVKATWEQQLASFGASQPEFLVQEDNIPRQLDSCLRFPSPHLPCTQEENPS
ncbi:MAG: hypothetical protein WC935_09835 [Thermoleophilia bacterium]